MNKILENGCALMCTIIILYLTDTPKLIAHEKLKYVTVRARIYYMEEGS